MTHYIFNLKLKSSNQDFILAMLNDTNHYTNYQQNTLSKTLKYFFNIDMQEPTTLLNSVFHNHANQYSSSDEVEDDHLTEYIADPDNTVISDPEVYIYNTHQLESYSQDYQEYNITPNVQMASYLLKGLLNKSNVNTIVETGNINDFLSANGWSYSYSYLASKYYIEEALNNNPNLKLLIDLHRDSLPKEKSTVSIDDKNYAKILFVIGTDYENYLDNLSVATKLNNIIEKNYPTLTRGIITKGGEGVNGVYNQDLNTNIILIECGGNENSIDEVMNTILVLKDAIIEYLHG
jgi:stage II sporulation protein P